MPGTFVAVFLTVIDYVLSDQGKGQRIRSVGAGILGWNTQNRISHIVKPAVKCWVCFTSEDLIKYQICNLEKQLPVPAGSRRMRYDATSVQSPSSVVTGDTITSLKRQCTSFCAPRSGAPEQGSGWAIY